MTEHTSVLPMASTPRAPGAVRPIHYLGSKVRLLPQIEALADEVNPEQGPALDLFSGSGVVAAHLARCRDVIAVDIQEYARVLAAALLSHVVLEPEDIADLMISARAAYDDLAAGALAAMLAHEQHSLRDARAGRPGALCEMSEHGILVHERGEAAAGVSLRKCLDDTPPLATSGAGLAGRMVLTRFYGGVYFGFDQALKLDALYGAMAALPAAARTVACAALLSTTSDTVTSVGNQFAQPVRPRGRDGLPKQAAVSALISGRRRDPFASFVDWCRTYGEVAARRNQDSTKAAVVRGDYREYLATSRYGVGVIYADPPYTRDHYSRFYHVLETIALGDEPLVSTVQLSGRCRLSRGLYRSERHQSPFSIKTQAGTAFEALFDGVRRMNAPLIVSYSPFAETSGQRPRLMHIDQIATIARRHFADVEVRPANNIVHSKLNVTRLNAPQPLEAEIFLVCRP